MSTTYVIDAPQQASVGVVGSGSRFPLRRVFCVGRNYAAHAREMGNDPDREPPFFFMKPADAVVPAEGVVPYPPQTANLHHEIEMVVALGKDGRNVSPDDALALVWGYGVALDLTRRDLQDVAKKMSRPWDLSKGFDASAPCSQLVPAQTIGHPNKGRIWFEVNGSIRQEGDLTEMIWKIPEVISHISQSVELRPGDLIFTGTPAGVGELKHGDRLRGGVDGIAEFEFQLGN